MTNEEYNKWLILYFDMQSINLQFNCNDIASSLKAQRDKIKQFCIDCLTGVKYQADSFLFDTNACIFSTSETRELLFSHEEYLILEVDTTKAVDGKYPLDYATEIVESNLDDIIDYIVQSGTETYNDRTSRGFRNRWRIDVVFKVRTGKGYWRGSKYLYVCNNNTIYLLGSDAGIHHVTEELPSNLEAKVREYKP